MKIAFIVSQFPVVSETFILNQITGLLDRGHEVNIFAESQGICSKIHADVEKYNLSKHTYYLNIPVNKFFRYLKGTGLIITNFHKKPAIILKSLNILAFGKKAATLHMLYSVIRFLDKGPYDIVHCHFGPCGIMGVLLKDIGVFEGKIITTFYGYDATSYPKIYGKSIYKDLFRKIDLITVISNFIKSKVKELGCSEDKITKLPLGLNSLEFFLKEKSIKPGGEIKILTVARLVEKKGVEYSIKAVVKVLENHPNVVYSIVGDGPLRDRLLGLIEERGVKNNVKLLGWKNQNEIRQLYSDAHLFILSSVTASDGDQEGQGLVLLEAQAMGLPVISTLHNGIPDSVLDGQSGFLVPEKDINALAERLEYLIEHHELWPEIGRAGRRYVEENFDIHKLNDRLIKIYQQLLSGKVL